MPKKNKKLASKSRIQTYQILSNDDEVCIPSLSSILLAVRIKMPIGSDNWDVETYRNKFEFFYYVLG